LASGYRTGMHDDVAERLGQNVRQLREGRGLTQLQLARVAGIPRATWGNLESGAGNPTLAVLQKVATALQVTMEELVSKPKAAVQFHVAATLPLRTRGGARVRGLLPDPIPGMSIERIEIAARSSMTGVPHTPGTREYLTCETGEIVLSAAGEQWTLAPGDVVVFRGDQKHAYGNPGGRVAVGYSVVLLARV